MASVDELIKYYNKFSEDKRLSSRHGLVEKTVTIHYIQKYLNDLFKNVEDVKILDVGAGTGAYSIYFANIGYDVTAVELVKFNLGILKSKSEKVKAYQGDARSLKKFKDDSFDVVFLFGPMYHLISWEDKLKAMKEAKRVLKTGGLIFVAYVMNDYALITHGFKDGNIKLAYNSASVDKNFRIVSNDKDLYSYVTIEDINNLKNQAGFSRVTIFAPDGPADYMRQSLNKMDEETFKLFIEYQKCVAERPDLLGASSHIVDVLKKL